MKMKKIMKENENKLQINSLKIDEIFNFNLE